MSEMHVDCPHCGASFDISVDGDVSSMMVFSCARCKSPLMRYHGEIVELDRKEFAGLRRKLSRVIEAVMKEGEISEVANALRQIVEKANTCALEKSAHSLDSEENGGITEKSLESLIKNLDEMNSEDFINSL
ncbi:MAG: hypothetical protein HUK21_04060 [Fibrobacteraceae bacterium]|nr:hypothetical protein [Fibrobacteraceae bacterium]